MRICQWSNDQNDFNCRDSYDQCIEIRWNAIKVGARAGQTIGVWWSSNDRSIVSPHKGLWRWANTFWSPIPIPQFVWYVNSDIKVCDAAGESDEIRVHDRHDQQYKQGVEIKLHSHLTHTHIQFSPAHVGDALPLECALHVTNNNNTHTHRMREGDGEGEGEKNTHNWLLAHDDRPFVRLTPARCLLIIFIFEFSWHFAWMSVWSLF